MLQGRALSPERLQVDRAPAEKAQKVHRAHPGSVRPATAVVDRARRIKALRDEREAALKKLQF